MSPTLHCLDPSSVLSRAQTSRSSLLHQTLRCRRGRFWPRQSCGLQALSPVGRCKTFDVSADGYGRGEGCVVAILRHAIQDQPSDSACALLSGTAVNQDGRSSSLTAPNGPAQSSLVASTLQAAGASLPSWSCAPHMPLRYGCCVVVTVDEVSGGANSRALM